MSGTLFVVQCRPVRRWCQLARVGNQCRTYTFHILHSRLIGGSRCAEHTLPTGLVATSRPFSWPCIPSDILARPMDKSKGNPWIYDLRFRIYDFGSAASGLSYVRWFAVENQFSVGSWPFGSSSSERAKDLSPLRPAACCSGVRISAIFLIFSQHTHIEKRL